MTKCISTNIENNSKSKEFALEAIKIVHHFKPIAYKLAPALYVVGEKAILNWNAKKDQADHIRCDGGDGSRSLLDHLPNCPDSC